MYDGFVERARAVERLLHDRRTTFLVVTTLDDVDHGQELDRGYLAMVSTGPGHAEQVRAQNGKGVTFIQQEIYQDNDPGKPYRSQVLAWRLPTEPWTFVIDRRGKIAARFEGVFSTGELARAVARVK